LAIYSEESCVHDIFTQRRKLVCEAVSQTVLHNEINRCQPDASLALHLVIRYDSFGRLLFKAYFFIILIGWLLAK
jgi:hypothetical protein